MDKNKKISLGNLYDMNKQIMKKQNNNYINNILSYIDVLIDGPFIEDKKDLTLKLRGSTNQRILYKNIDF